MIPVVPVYRMILKYLWEILLRTRKPQSPHALSKEEVISLKAFVHNSHLYSLKISTGNAQHLF